MPAHSNDTDAQTGRSQALLRRRPDTETDARDGGASGDDPDRGTDDREPTPREQYLQARVDVLEARLDRQRDDLQAVIDRYEALLAEQRQAYEAELREARRENASHVVCSEQERARSARSLADAVKKLVPDRR